MTGRDLKRSSMKKIMTVEDERIVARDPAVTIVLKNMTTHRSYRDALPLSEALEQISSHSGSLYDPGVAEACSRLFREKGFQFNPDGGD